MEYDCCTSYICSLGQAYTVEMVTVFPAQYYQSAALYEHGLMTYKSLPPTAIRGGRNRCSYHMEIAS